MLAPAIRDILRIWLPLLPIIAPTLPEGTRSVTVSCEVWFTVWFPPEQSKEMVTPHCPYPIYSALYLNRRADNQLVCYYVAQETFAFDLD